MANRRQLEEGFYLINPQAKELLTISSEAKALTSSVYGSYTRARIQCQDADVRYWLTGDVPTAADGVLLYNKSSLELRTAEEIAGFKAIKDDSTDAVLAIMYYN